MYQFDKIKLIIWDLDETFWQGVLSEGEVVIPDKNIELIKALTDIGIVNSICSKNYPEPAQKELDKFGLWEFFVFPSINWEAKGSRIKQLIKDMQLRPANVLFLDDNHSNREEAKFFCPDIMVADPNVLPQLIEEANISAKKDKDHKRLKQYKVLEEKHSEKSNYSSNEQFLMDSNIQLKIENDCMNHLERIQDLVMRSNQLNFTKIRSSVEELKELFSDNSYQCSYVSVSDKFGDYGIVGFYALKEGELLHFVFSCRTLGMGIEQYVYNFLNRPTYVLQGEVISDLSSTELPKWINQNGKNTRSEKMEVRNLSEHTVLIKGPCDLYQVYPYIANTEMFDTEFSHTTDNGVYVDSTSHTTFIVESSRLSEEQVNLVVDEVPFVDYDSYSRIIFCNTYKVIIISILDDANLGVYKRKTSGERLAFAEYIHPITDSKNWDKIITGEYVTNGFKFTKEILESFQEKYEFVGRNTPEQIVENLRFIRTNLPYDCTLVIMLGGELEYKKNKDEAYKDRHIIHKHINTAIREYAKDKDNIRLLDVNKYLVDQSSFYDHFNHYIKPVYYKLAEEMVNIINECTGSNIKETSKLKMVQIRLKEMLAPLYYKIRKVLRKSLWN